MDNIVVIRGGGDIATGIGYRLYKAGFNIVILDVVKPLAIRRTVSFCEAIYDGEIIVEGIKAVYCNEINLHKVINEGSVPVLIDECGESIHRIKPIAVVDSILAKRNIGTNKSMAPITIGVGPGFNAGFDVDLVVESNRGHNLGKVIHQGQAEKNSGIPGDIMGYKEERIVRAIESGQIEWFINIGDIVNKDDVIGNISKVEIKAGISGVMRGLIKNELYVDKGLKIGDIDPRGKIINVMTISDKARAIGGGVLEGIMYLKNRRTI